MKMTAVRSQRGCSRSRAANSKPSRCGMQTSVRMTATSVSQLAERVTRRRDLDQVLAEIL